jgi:hypothetical protein
MNKPDWLDDVALLETKGPEAPPAACHNLPDWLDDLRFWYGLPPLSAAAPPSPKEADALKDMGIDARTGQIVDLKQFRQWQHKKVVGALAGTGQPRLSLMEAFHRGRVAIDEWVDDDTHRDLILRGEMDEIRNSTGVVRILDQYAEYGPVMKEKLLQRLAFTVENRRKYNAAHGGKVY